MNSRFSDAALAYWAKVYPGNNLRIPTISTYDAALAAFDAGCAHALATVTPRTISTESELDALPVGSVVTDGDRDAWQKNRDEEWVMVGCEGACPSRHVFSDAELKHPVTLLVPASESASEPERLTDANDERIKPGARVRQVRDDMTVVDSQAPFGVDNISLALLKDAVKAPYAGESWYLLAEAAPSPDAEIVSTLAAVLGADMSAALVPEVLDRIRSAGLDIVKREADQ